uniref:ABC transmembrane type-1 domain-containing protein n=1 Tax=Macrostomum lignano TaxID=282301 RepID=A0A1I8JPQ2_9PLAT
MNAPAVHAAIDQESLTESNLFALNRADVCTKTGLPKSAASGQIRAGKMRSKSAPVPVSYQSPSEEERTPGWAAAAGGPIGPGGAPAERHPCSHANREDFRRTRSYCPGAGKIVLRILFQFIKSVAAWKFVIEYVEDTSIPARKEPPSLAGLGPSWFCLIPVNAAPCLHPTQTAGAQMKNKTTGSNYSKRSVQAASRWLNALRLELSFQRQRENVLTAGKAFTAVSLFNILRVPLSASCAMIIAPMLVTAIGVGETASRSSYPGEEIGPNLVLREPHRPGRQRIEVSGADFCSEKGTAANPSARPSASACPTERRASPAGRLRRRRRKVVVMVAGVLGDMLKPRGSVSNSGQGGAGVPAGVNATLRDNIQFTAAGTTIATPRCWTVCALRPDRLEIFARRRDMTEIEREVTHHVGKHIFDGQVIGPNACWPQDPACSSPTATPAGPFVDNILVLRPGNRVGAPALASYEQLMSRNGPFAQFLKQYITSAEENEADEETGEIGEHEEPEVARLKEEVLSRVERPHLRRRGRHQPAKQPHQHRPQLQPSGGRRLSRRMSSRQQDVEQIKEEAKRSARNSSRRERSATGNVKYQVFLAYFKAMNLRMTVSFFLFFILTASVFANVWLSIWTEDPYLNNASIPSNTSEYAALQNLYLGGYGAIGAAQAVFVVLIYALLAAVAFVISPLGSCTPRCSATSCAPPMSFFDTTPVGRIVNRFSRDIETIDNLLPQMFRSWISTFFNVMSTIVVISFSTPAFMSVIVPLGRAIRVRPALLHQHVEAAEANRVHHQVADLHALQRDGDRDADDSSLRRVGRFVNESHGARVDYNQILLLCRHRGQSLAGFHLDFCGALSVLARPRCSPVIGRGQRQRRHSGPVRVLRAAVERLEEYAKVQTEAEWDIPQTRPPPSWPPAGAGDLQRLRRALPGRPRPCAARHHLRHPVWREGRHRWPYRAAGKSSLTLALFRIIEAARGRVTIDGEDISGWACTSCAAPGLTILP